MTFRDELVSHIKACGTITVAKYIARCNAHYYATRDPFGTQGDFITAPEISQIFGELTGAWMADYWGRMAQPKACLCELGPGRGTLMKDMLRVTKPIAGFHDALDILLVETSPHLRNRQKAALMKSHPRIRWQDTMDALPPLPLLLIANEFFDALPVRQYVRDNLEEKERTVQYDSNRFVFQPRGEVIREDSPQSIAIAGRIAAHIKTFGGAALIVDYGYVHGEQGDTLQAMHHHQLTDILAHPGEADLTAHVDFARLAQTMRNGGAQVHGPVTQGMFLKRLGAEWRATALCRAAAPEKQESLLSGLERLVAPHQMGELFKVMAITSLLDSAAGF